MDTTILYEFLQFCAVIYFMLILWNIAKSLRKIAAKK